MGLVVYLGEMLEVKVGIDLCRAYAGVSQKLLDAAQIVARFEHVRGEGMPQQVWINLGRDALFLCPVIDACLDRARAQTGSLQADEQGSLIGFGQGDPFSQPGADCLERVFSDGQDALLLTLAGDTRSRVGNIDVADIEPRQFGKPQARRVHEFEHRPVSYHERPLARNIQKVCHAIGIEVFRKPLSRFRCTDRCDRIHFDVFFPCQVSEKSAGGRKLTLNAPR